MTPSRRVQRRGTDRLMDSLCVCLGNEGDCVFNEISAAVCSVLLLGRVRESRACVCVFWGGVCINFSRLKV